MGQQTFVKETYYDDLQTKRREFITLSKKDSSLNGLYQLQYENSSVAVTGYYVDNESDSIWTYYFENGNIRSKGTYTKGLQNGLWEYYFENGQKKAVGRFQDNIKHGQWTHYFESGQEKSSGIYFDNKKEGIWNYFYEDGTLKAQVLFERDRGVYNEFYPDGKLKMEGLNENGKSEGEWVYYYNSGELEARGHFQEGQKQGPWEYYYKNGQPSARGHYQQGEKSGVWRYYYQDGSISSEGNMQRNKQDGFWKLYYESGEIKGEATYDDGSGQFVEYYPGGQIKSEGTYAEGLKSDQWTYYSEDGNLEGKAVYSKGVGQYTGFYPDGSVKMTGKMEGDRRTGQWTLYEPDGTIAGLYTPVYEEQKPIFRTGATASTPKRSTLDKPEYRYRKKSIRYFKPTINEYMGYILGTNPLWLMVGELPVALEYYIQERQGYEAQITLLRNPLFNYQEKRFDRLYKTGAELQLRQKFYHEDSKIGMFYFGHGLIAKHTIHNAYIDNTFPAPDTQANASETSIAYAFLVGNRWMQRVEDSGLTLDFNIGFGVGRRFFNMNDENGTQSKAFDELNRSKLFLPLIVTLNLGYAGPKRRTTSF